jgi:hypothetical protein
LLVDPIGAPFERGGETPECGIEHRSHQQCQGTAPEFIGNEEFNAT